MARQRKSAADESPAGRLEMLAQEAYETAKKARKHRQNLANDNYYGNKLAALRTDATNALSELPSRSVADTTTLAELMETTFGASTTAPNRLRAKRDLALALRTTWKESSPAIVDSGSVGLFPLAILVQANRGYLATIGRQMNGCNAFGWHDASAVMMRRLVEIAIIEAFEHKKIADRIKDANGDYVQLTVLIDRALAEPALTLSRGAKSALPKLRDVGHQSAHGRYFTAQIDDIERIRPGCRLVIEEFLRHAGLL